MSVPAGFVCNYAKRPGEKCLACDCFVDMYPDSSFDLHPEAFIVGRLLPICEDCGGPVDETGCLHDDHAWCRYCLPNCRQCLAAMLEDWNL